MVVNARRSDGFLSGRPSASAVRADKARTSTRHSEAAILRLNAQLVISIGGGQLNRTSPGNILSFCYCEPEQNLRYKRATTHTTVSRERRLRPRVMNSSSRRYEFRLPQRNKLFHESSASECCITRAPK